METLLLDAGSPGAIDKAAALLTAGELVALPTETVYGLAADAARPDALATIFQAKERPLFDPLIVHLPDLEWLERLATPSSAAQAELTVRLAEAFWPGPLTMVLPRRADQVPDLVTAGGELVAVRMSAHPVFQAVIGRFGRPLAAPSANRFGRISPTTGAHVRSELSGRLPLILDAGPTAHGLESTVIVPGDDGKTVRVLRHGPITSEALGKFARVTAGESSDPTRAASPGQTSGHYAPRTPLVFLRRGQLAARRVGLLAYRPGPGHERFAAVEVLSADGDLRTAAAGLFAALRRLDEAGLDLIVAEPVPEEGLGRAIMERLRRAAAGSGNVGAPAVTPLVDVTAPREPVALPPIVPVEPAMPAPPVAVEPTPAAQAAVPEAPVLPSPRPTLPPRRPAVPEEAPVEAAAATSLPSREVSAPSSTPELTPTPTGSAASRGSTKAAGIVGLAVMCSRVLGLARDQIFAGIFGAGTGTDAFLTAFRAPNLLRDLFAEGALSTAFVTTFSKKIQLEGDRSAWRLANKMATLTLVFMSVVTLLGILLAGPLIEVLGGGFHAVPGKFELTVHLTRIMYPFILLVSLAALAMGMLNAKHVFGAPALASSFFNLGSIVGGVTLAWWMDPHFDPAPEKIARALIGMAVGTLIGGFLQFAVQLPALARAGYRFAPDFRWKDEGVRTILRLMGPAVVAASAVQINVMVNASFASHQGNGAVTWLNNSFRLMQLPLGVFGVAIATVTLPLVSKAAALGDTGEFRATLAKALRLAFFLTIPSAIGLICLGEPIISLLYQHGRFTIRAAHATAAALQFYAVGLAAYSGIKVLAPAFYALDARTTPMTVSFIAIGVNFVLNALFTYTLGWGHRGLALSTSLTAIANFTLLYILMRRRVGDLDTRALLVMFGKLTVAGAALAATCLLGQAVLLDGFDHFRLVEKIFGLFTVIFAAAGAFFAVCYFLRFEEMQEAVGIVRRKLRRRPGRGR